MPKAIFFYGLITSKFDHIFKKRKTGHPVWFYCGMKSKEPNKYGDEAPELKHMIIVLVAVALLIAFGWISWHWLGWFH